MNSKADQFLKKNKELVNNLKSGLTNVVNKLDREEIIPQNDRQELTKLLDDYIKQLKVPVSAIHLRREKQKNVEKYDTVSVVRDFKDFNEGIVLLMRIAQEKLVEPHSCKNDTDKVLLEKGYIEKVISEDSDKEYYLLSEKGVKCLKNKMVINKFKKQVPYFSIPDNTLTTFDEWDETYAKRVQMLKDYFTTIKENVNYFIFPASEDKNMIMGCEIADTVETDYVFPAITKEDVVERDMGMINAMVASGFVDHITLIVNNQQEEEMITKRISTDKISIISLNQ